MPRTYVRKTDKGKWTTLQMQNAIAAVENGMAIREASREFNIAESTIRKKIRLGDMVDLTQKPHLGRHTIFSPEQEVELVEHVIQLAKVFFGITPLKLRKLAFDYAEANGIKHNFNRDRKMAGKDWYYQFMRRHSQISLRKPEATSINRIKAFNEEDVKLFFRNLDSMYQKYRFKPDSIYNVDESGITTVQKPAKCLGPKGIKQLGYKTSGERGKNVTVICCMSAAGKYVAPMFIFPRKRMTDTLAKNGPVGAVYSCSPTGWSNEELFLDWIKHFHKSEKPSIEDPVLIIMDNHSSHISLNIYDFCKTRGIVLITLPPHTSHRLQPLDLTFFGPLKSVYHRECDLKLRTSERITTYDLAEIFNKAYLRVATMDKAISGFNAAGIYPFQPDKFSPEDFVAASHFLPVTLENDTLHQHNGDVTTTSNSSEHQEYSQQSSCSHSLDLPGCSRQSTPPPLTVNASSSTAMFPHLPKKCASVATVASLSPIPSPPSAPAKGRQKQKSKILTATPNKEELLEAEAKRQQRKLKVDAKSKSSTKKGKTKAPKRKIEKTDSESDDNIDPNNICDDDELDDLNPGGEQDICLICGDSSRKNEVWYRCTVCSGWSHALCSGVDSPENYECDFCDT